MTRIDRNSANTKIYAYEIKQNVSKNVFLLLRMPPQLTALRTVLFSAITHNRLLFSHSKNNFSTIFTPPTTDIYKFFRVFFVDSIYSKTIDIIRKISIFFYFYILFIFILYKADHPDNGAILQVASSRVTG